MPTLRTLTHSLRNVKRAGTIVQVLVRYGFADVLHLLELDRIVPRGILRAGSIPVDVASMPLPVRLRKVMEELGPTFIKMAQILSTRPDLIPPDWAEEFAHLQSDVPALPADEIKAHLEEVYGRSLDELFTSVEFEALGAASMAQAHGAVLKDGTPVVLKVLRPGIEHVLEADIEILAALAAIAEGHFGNLGYSPVQVVDEFARQVRRECDLSLEGHSTERMARGFREDPRVRFPEVYWSHTRPGVLCQQRIEGILLSDRRSDGFTEEDRREIVSLGTDAVFRQCFEIGFFHADPHPGNIFVVHDDGEPAICFIDCGMTGHIDPRTSEMLAALIHATVGGDVDRVMDVVIGLVGASPALAADRAFRADVWAFVSRFESMTLGELQMGMLLRDFFQKIRRHHLQCPADIVYLVKAVTTIEGVGERLDPDFNIVEHVRPYLERLIRRRYGFRATRRRVERASGAYAELIESAPGHVRELVHFIRKDRVNVHLDMEGLSKFTREVDRSSSHIFHAIIISSLVVGSSIFFLADAVRRSDSSILSHVGWVLLGLAAIVAGVRFVLRRTPWG